VNFIKRYAQLLVEAFSVWNAINAGRLAGSIAFFGMLSIAPMLFLAVSIASWLLSVQQEVLLVELLDGMLGDQAAQVADSIIAQQSGPSVTGGVIISLISIGTFLWSATTLFSLLKLALDEIWAIPSDRSSLMRMVRRKLTALIVVLIFGLLLTIVFAITTAANRNAGIVSDLPSQAGYTAIDLLSGFIPLMLIMAAMFKYVPDFHLAWRDLWGGAAITALAIVVAKAPLQYYMNRVATSSTTGAASTVVVLLFAIYVMALIFFFGASFVRVYAHRYGSLKGTPYQLPNQR
jgi:membrane protein